jgi:hypothetical protein
MESLSLSIRALCEGHLKCGGCCTGDPEVYEEEGYGGDGHLSP